MVYHLRARTNSRFQSGTGENYVFTNKKKLDKFLKMELKKKEKIDQLYTEGQIQEEVGYALYRVKTGEELFV
jgi:hypothetical protein